MQHNLVHLGYLASYNPSEKEIKAAKEGKPVMVPSAAAENPPFYLNNPDLPPPTLHDIVTGKIGTTPSYSMDIMAAWRIIHKFSLENIGFKMEHTEPKKWTVTFIQDGTGISLTSKTASLAICLASLKFRGIDLEKCEIPSDLY
jgi:hypothetical protein